jgi:hypothetical protein
MRQKLGGTYGRVVCFAFEGLMAYCDESWNAAAGGLFDVIFGVYQVNGTP